MDNFNWIDIIILIILAFYVIQGYSIGFFASLLDLISFALSFAIGLKFYSIPSDFLIKTFSWPQGISYAIGFFLIALLSEIIIGFVLSKPFKPTISRIKRIFGILPGLLSGLVLASFLLTLVVSLPVSIFLKKSIFSSRIGSLLIGKSLGFEKDLKNIFGGKVGETLNFLTVKPTSNEVINLNFKPENLSIDKDSESSMLAFVNKERVSRGLSLLTFNGKLRILAEGHCMDMFKRGYFSHYTLGGLSPFDRMGQQDISYTYAGENLALSGSVGLAMQGLMQSEEHRANILSPNFGKLGVGVIDGGTYGQMYCQEFTD